jgi:hypothetical protein
MRLRWDSGPGLDISGRAQLDQALDQLLAGPAASRPLIAFLVGDSGALGLGLDPAGGGLLLFSPTDRERPALHGVGESPCADDTVFSVRGQPYRFSGRCRVAPPTVRAAAQQYLATSELPDCIEWEPEPGSPPHQARA